MDELVKRLKNCATQAAPCLTCDMTDDGSCIETLMKQAADAIDELQKAVLRLEEESGLLDELPMYQQPVGWIPVTERLPEPNAIDERGFVKGYLVKTDRHVMMHTARYNGEWWILWGKAEVITDTVTHWMPLPTPPKEE